MASFSPFRMPEYEVPKNAMLDFSGINSALDTVNANQYKNAQLGMEQKKLGMDEERLGLQKAAGTREQESHEDTRRTKLAQTFAGIGQMVLEEKDPARQSEMYQRFVASDPRIKETLGKHLPKEVADDPVVGSRYFVALGRGYQDPDVKAQQAAQTRMLQSHADLYDAQARTAAEKPNTFDLGPDHVRYRQNPDGTTTEVARGGVKLNATTQKEIDETDTNILNTKGALGDLKMALQLTDKAYSGTAASGRAGLINNVPMLGGTESSKATAQLENLITSQALQSMRSIFGANPTEGERQILLAIQGSVNENADVRKQIYQRAAAQAEKRLEFNKRKSAALRDGTYYNKPFDFDDGSGPGKKEETQQRSRARNPKTGEMVEWDGQSWVPVK